MEIENKVWYDKHYKIMLLIPVLLFIFSIGYLINFQIKNGDIIYKDVSLTGGTTITVFDANVKIDEIKSALEKDFSDISIREILDFRTGAQKGFILETKATTEKIKPALEDYLGYVLNQNNSSIEFSGESVSLGFYKQLRFSVLIAFLLMALVVFLIFRTFVPSAAVIFAALADITMTLFVVDIFGITLSVAGIVSFLMLIGYSVDTDILLTTRVLKGKEGSVNERIYGAFKTGMTMTLTAIAAISVSLFFVYSASGTLRQMFTIILIGLFFDMINTWLTNASIIKWYAEKKVKT
ncbi:MAG: protein translocase subunit SecF [Nanoarchaeota archaeon]